MKKNNTNTKRTPRATAPAKLTYRQLDRLARGLALDLMQDPATGAVFMLLMDEIAKHPFDHSHVETIAHLVNAHLFAVTHEANDAFALFITAEREKFIGEGGA